VSTRSSVLTALRQAAGRPVSGEALAHTIGVSRVAIGKHVTALRNLGYDIDVSRPGGYTLLGAPDLAIPEEVEPLLRDRLWVRVEGGLLTDSTNDDARALARAGAEQGTVVVASRQSAGRGRLGRSWVSPEGGAYLSVVLRPSVAPAEIGPLPLVVGLGVARGLATLSVETRLKWPNDVLLGEGKVAGVLLEMSAEGEAVRWVVAGVGLNVRAAPDALPGAAHVSDACPGVGVPTAAAAVLDGIASAYREWREGTFAALRDEYLARFALTGTPITVSDASGQVRADGIVVGVDADGRLLVEEPGGMRAVAGGEVTTRRPA
jgi:BirA family biotin operon repressor/biotin-[acetyl-CoA-carboxylase] ligase